MSLNHECSLSPEEIRNRETDLQQVIILSEKAIEKTRAGAAALGEAASMLMDALRKCDSSLSNHYAQISRQLRLREILNDIMVARTKMDAVVRTITTRVKNPDAIRASVLNPELFK
jgi:hypothetical protein